MKMDDKIFEEIREEAKEETRNKNLLQPISFKELFKIKFPENQWAVQDLVPLEGITIISGPPANFKSWIILQMAIDISKGEKLFDRFECQKQKVLIVDEENHPSETQKRAKMLVRDEDLSIFFLSEASFQINQKKFLTSLLKFCEENEIGVVFFDSLVRIHSSDENSASDMAQVFQKIKKLCHNKLTVVLTHHEKKITRELQVISFKQNERFF